MTTDNPWDTGTETATMSIPKPAKIKMYSGDTVYVTLRGRLGTDVELMRLPSGTKVARGRLAVSRRGRDDAGIWHDVSTNWYTIKMWNQLAENAAVSLFKGQPVLVTGRLEVNEWKNSENGTRGSELVVTAKSIGHDLSLGKSNFTRLKKEGYSNASNTNPGANGSGGAYGGGSNYGNEGGAAYSDDEFSYSTEEPSDPMGVGQNESALV